MTPVIYLHGFASGPSSGKAQFFARQFRAVGVEIQIPDLNAGDFEHLTITRQVQQIEALAGGKPVSLIGSSMGGYLASLYAARHPEVHRLALLAPAFGFARRWPQSLGEEVAAEWQGTGWREVMHYGDGVMRKLHYGLVEDGQRYEDYPDFRQPALIFHGAQDDIVPASYSQEFAAAHANAHLEILDTAHDMHNVLDYMGPRVTAFFAQ